MIGAGIKSPEFKFTILVGHYSLTGFLDTYCCVWYVHLCAHFNDMTGNHASLSNRVVGSRCLNAEKYQHQHN